MREIKKAGWLQTDVPLLAPLWPPSRERLRKEGENSKVSVRSKQLAIDSFLTVELQVLYGFYTIYRTVSLEKSFEYVLDRSPRTGTTSL